MGTQDLQPDDDGTRQAARVALDEATRLRPNSWSSVEVRVVNLSRTGFRAECDARLTVGSCVSLDIAGIGAVEAQVEWRRHNLFGAKFLHPILLEACDWTPRARQPVLAHLLVDRAAAHRAGRIAAERRIRAKILGAGPVLVSHRGAR